MNCNKYGCVPNYWFIANQFICYLKLNWINRILICHLSWNGLNPFIEADSWDDRCLVTDPNDLSSVTAECRVLRKRLRDAILYDLIGFIQASIPLIMLEIQSYRIGKWFIYLWAKVHISLTNSSYIFDEWFIYLSILEVIGNNAKCIYILDKKYR